MIIIIDAEKFSIKFNIPLCSKLFTKQDIERIYFRILRAILINPQLISYQMGKTGSIPLENQYKTKMPV